MCITIFRTLFLGCLIYSKSPKCSKTDIFQLFMTKRRHLTPWWESTEIQISLRKICSIVILAIFSEKKHYYEIMIKIRDKILLELSWLLFLIVLYYCKSEKLLITLAVVCSVLICVMFATGHLGVASNRCKMSIQSLKNWTELWKGTRLFLEPLFAYFLGIKEILRMCKFHRQYYYS